MGSVPLRVVEAISTCFVVVSFNYKNSKMNQKKKNPNGGKQKKRDFFTVATLGRGTERSSDSPVPSPSSGSRSDIK